MSKLLTSCIPNSFQYLLIAGFLALSGPAARADLVTYNITEVTSQTLRSLGTSFVVGCSVLALGLVIAAVIWKKK